MVNEAFKLHYTGIIILQILYCGTEVHGAKPISHEGKIGMTLPRINCIFDIVFGQDVALDQ